VADPLKGRRQAINNGSCSPLFWPDHGQGCPVDVGELYSLRSCGIEITRKERTRKDGKWVWRADFIRYRRCSDKPYLLSKSGITTDHRFAVRAQDDLERAGTIDAIDQDDRSDAHRNAGEPPEPEGIAPEDVADLPTSLEARQRYELQRAEVRRAEAQAPLSERIQRIHIQARQRHIDISPEIRVIERRVGAMERKVRGEAA
jgi:hypothetical protein